MTTQNYKIYDNTGRLIVDSETDYFDCNHVTLDEWCQIFHTDIKHLILHNKAGDVVVSLGEV